MIYIYIKLNLGHPILAYTSSVGEIGLIEESFYRSGDNGAFQALIPKDNQISKYELQYILSILKKHFDTYGYATSMAHIIDLSFSLPVTDTGSPNYNYMVEIENNQLKRTKMFIESLGLSDCTLTEEEKKYYL